MSFHNSSDLNVIFFNYPTTITSIIMTTINQTIVFNISSEINTLVEINNNNSLIVKNSTNKNSNRNETNFQNNVIVPLYAVIFLLSVVGNLLVILTLAQNKRMRTVTNVYLLNLVSFFLL